MEPRHLSSTLLPAQLLSPSRIAAWSNAPRLWQIALTTVGKRKALYGGNRASRVWMGDIQRAEGTPVSLMSEAVRRGSRGPAGFLWNEPKLCPPWAFCLPFPLRGEMRETGEALSLWQGFFCFQSPLYFRSGKPIPANIDPRRVTFIARTLVDPPEREAEELPEIEPGPHPEPVAERDFYRPLSCPDLGSCDLKSPHLLPIIG